VSAVLEQVTLEDLMSRAGASDVDRELWLAERRSGVTATEVRDLYLLGESFKRQLIKDKLSDKPTADLSHIPVIGWGRDRETVIAGIIDERYAIAPESRVFHAADNSRFLASPDGVGEGFDGSLRVSEIKTAGGQIATDSALYKKKGYGLQQQWVMRVTGARISLYGWEERIEIGPNEFEPGELRFEWVEYEEALAAELEKIATEFLADLDEARRALDAGEVALIDDELDTLAFNVIKFREAEASAKKSKEQVWRELQVQSALASGEKHKGGSFSQESLLARVTYNVTPAAESVVSASDPEAAQAADPELFESLTLLQGQWHEHLEKFKKEVPVSTPAKATLTVTAPKIKELKA